MNAIGVLLLAAATSTGGLFGKPHVGGAQLTRGGVVADGPAPPGGPMMPQGGPGGPGAAQGQAGRRFPNVRSQVFFVEPTAMHIGWQTATGATGPGGPEKVYLPAQLTVPARYNFTQGYIYRLKLTDIAGRPGLQLYPTIEVAPSTPATDAYLTHNPIPAIFSEEDFDNVVAGNFVTKVIYLPDPKYQELAVSGVETLVSTKLEPGVDPIVEADRRGTILMIIRVGAIDLEMPAGGNSSPPPVTVPVDPGMTAPRIMIPGSVLPMKPVAPTPVIPLEAAPAPATTPAPVPAPADTPPVPAVETPKPVDPAMPADAPAPKPVDVPKPPESPLGSLDVPVGPRN